jgi:hypothetical protein
MKPTLASACCRIANSQRSFFNDKGQEVGRSTTRGNTTTIQDNMGREVGRTERRPDGTTNFYDSAGRMIGSSKDRR